MAGFFIYGGLNPAYRADMVGALHNSIEKVETTFKVVSTLLFDEKSRFPQFFRLLLC
jgi:hypothetical protein